MAAKRLTRCAELSAVSQIWGDRNCLPRKRGPAKTKYLRLSICSPSRLCLGREGRLEIPALARLTLSFCQLSWIKVLFLCPPFLPARNKRKASLEENNIQILKLTQCFFIRSVWQPIKYSQMFQRVKPKDCKTRGEKKAEKTELHRSFTHCNYYTWTFKTNGMSSRNKMISWRILAENGNLLKRIT